jgi:hypothetical protein
MEVLIIKDFIIKNLFFIYLIVVFLGSSGIIIGAIGYKEAGISLFVLASIIMITTDFIYDLSKD